MPRKAAEKANGPKQSDTPTRWETPALNDKDLRMTYTIARGEQGVLTFEPYKSILLPYWRFKTLPIATQSSATLYSAFQYYVDTGDFVGADMARKFIQMGMTRAKRYANHKGGRKYAKNPDANNKRVELEKSEGHEGREEKLEVSEMFKEVWRRCTADEDYVRLKDGFIAEQKAWEKGREKVKKEEDVKKEDEEGG
jgi:hypothetical protein